MSDRKLAGVLVVLGVVCCACGEDRGQARLRADHGSYNNASADCFSHGWPVTREGWSPDASFLTGKRTWRGWLCVRRVNGREEERLLERIHEDEQFTKAGQ